MTARGITAEHVHAFLLEIPIVRTTEVSTIRVSEWDTETPSIPNVLTDPSADADGTDLMD